MLFWFSYSWCLIQLQLHVMLLMVSSDSCRFLILLVRQTARCSPSLKTRKLQLLINTTLLLLCCGVLWFNNLQRELARRLFLAVQFNLRKISLTWRGGVVYVQVRIVCGKKKKIMIITDFIATYIYNQSKGWGAVIQVLWCKSVIWIKASMQFSGTLHSGILLIICENFCSRSCLL